MAEGFGTGFLQGLQGAEQQTQSSDEHKMAGLAFTEGQQKIQMNQQEIDKTRMMLDRQKQLTEKIAKLNGMSAPGSVPPSPQDQAREQANLHFQMADAAVATGMYEDARKEAELGGKLALNAAHIDQATAGVARDKAETTAGLMTWVKEAKTPQEMQQRWRTSLMAFQSRYGEQSPLADKQPTPELIDSVLRAATSRKSEAEIAEKNAATKRDLAQANLDARTAALRDKQAADVEKRTKLRDKEGGKTTKKEQKQTDALESSIDTIDEISGIIKAHPDETLTGLKGMGHAIAESVSSSLGSKADTPSRDMEGKLLFLKSQLQTALTGSNYSSKDKMAIIAAMSDIQKPGMGGAVGERRLAGLRAMLQKKLDSNVARPSSEQKVMTYDEYMAAQEDAASDAASGE